MTDPQRFPPETAETWLRRYGRHLRSCAVLMPADTGTCTCGFQAAIEAASRSPEPKPRMHIGAEERSDWTPAMAKFCLHALASTQEDLDAINRVVNGLVRSLRAASPETPEAGITQPVAEHRPTSRFEDGSPPVCIVDDETWPCAQAPQPVAGLDKLRALSEAADAEEATETARRKRYPRLSFEVMTARHEFHAAALAYVRARLATQEGSAAE